MNKEQVYDAQINPLMTQIIAICREHKIAMLCSFSLDLEEGLKCTTALLHDDFEPPDELREATNLVYKPKMPPLLVTVEHKDGSKEITAIL